MFFKIAITDVNCTKLTTNINAALRSLPIPCTGAESLAINLLKLGHIIALPTDTVYGLACCIKNVTAINDLYSIKMRDKNKPLAICLSNTCDIEHWAEINHLPKQMLSSLLPGPTTVILNTSTKLDHRLNFQDKIGIRIPNNVFIKDVINGLSCPIALTSANLSKKPNAVTVEQFQTLWPNVAAVFDGGDISRNNLNGAASTVVDLSNSGFYKIIRNGLAASEIVTTLRAFGFSELET